MRLLTIYKSWDDPTEECLRSHEGCGYKYRLAVRELRNSIDFQLGPSKNSRKRNNNPKKNSQPICVLQTPKKGWWLSACAFFCVLVLLVWALCFVQVVFVSQPKLEQKIMEVKPAKPGHFSMDLGEPTSQARLSEWRVWPYIFLGKL